MWQKPSSGSRRVGGGAAPPCSQNVFALLFTLSPVTHIPVFPSHSLTKKKSVGEQRRPWTPDIKKIRSPGSLGVKVPQLLHLLQLRVLLSLPPLRMVSSCRQYEPIASLPVSLTPPPKCPWRVDLSVTIPG